jgi:D-alanyl-D-alanine carboxypeptidase
MAEADRFRAQSLTKTFVAAATLQLVEAGRLRLDDTVARWVPGLLPRNEARTITLRQLLQHTSGISNLDSAPSLDRKLSRDIAHVFPPGELIALAAKEPRDFPAGTGWNYSNTGYLILGAIIEKATGQPIGTLLERQIFRPYGLRSTSFDPGPRIGGRFAHGYVRGQAGGYEDASTMTLGAWAAGAIVSTAGDLASFYAALLGGRILDATSMRELTTLVRATGPYYNDQRAGLGIFRYRIFCPDGAQREAWGHTGGSPAYSDIVLASRDGARVVVLMANTGRLGDKLYPVADDAFCRVAKT